MSQYAITVFGQDRPGIIAQTTEALGQLGLNVEDSTMTLLRGHFAMMLIVGGDCQAASIEAALEPVAADGTLTVTVREVVAEATPATGTSYLLNVHGADRPGIVAALVGNVAEVGGNVTDLSTRLIDGLYVLGAECDLPPGADAGALEKQLSGRAAELDVQVSWVRLESDDL